MLLGDGQGGFRDIGLSPSTVGGASAVAVGDFGNGFPDLAVTNFLSNNVSVFLGNGSGLFLQAPVNYTVGGNPRAILLADLQGNGILDIVTVNSTGNSICVLLGNGDGMFQPEIRYLTGSGTTAVVGGDFNGDGALDLATSNAVSGSVSVLLNRNDGTSPQARSTSSHNGQNSASAARAQATRFAALDVLFRGAPAKAIGQEPAVAARDAALSGQQVGALTTPAAHPAVAVHGTPQLHPLKQDHAAGAVGLDPVLLDVA